MRTIMMLRKLSISASALVLAACATGPNYVQKPVSASAAAPFVMTQGSTIVSDAQPSGNWWRLYDDPVLDGLVKDALASGARIAVAETILTLLDRSLELTEKRHQIGLANGLDTARIATLRDQRRAEIPLLEAERQGALFRLATLTRRTPRELPAEAAQRTSTLRLERPIPVGDGAPLLARRPHVRAAPRPLPAATPRTGVATPELPSSIH